MATDAAAPATMTLDRSDGSATIALYRATLGPLHTDYYLKAFTRFDATGTAGPSWNWSAALLSLNWLLFRQLWAHALAYVGALAAALLLLLGIGRLLFQLSDNTLWILLGSTVLLAFAVPGTWGNAWLYAACNKKMETALVAAATQEEACTLLGQGASGRRLQSGLAAGNLALAAVVAALVLHWPNSAELPLKTSRMEQARGAVEPTLATRSSRGLVQQATPLLPPTAEAAAPAAVAGVSSPAPAPAPAPASSAAPAASATAPTAEQFLINVGLFADANNARKAYAKLQNAGLPALSQTIPGTKGPRTRVRVGPFESQREADRAAEKIRALQLDAAVFKP